MGNKRSYFQSPYTTSERSPHRICGWPDLPITHDPALNGFVWQDDNAFDYCAPAGTPVYAIEDGTIGNQRTSNAGKRWGGAGPALGAGACRGPCWAAGRGNARYSSPLGQGQAALSRLGRARRAGPPRRTAATSGASLNRRWRRHPTSPPCARSLYLNAATNQYFYQHLGSYASGITTGTWVTKGKLLGFVGSLTEAPGAGTPHLHFAARDNPNGDSRDGMSMRNRMEWCKAP